MNKQFNSVLRLRRDNDFNYALIANKFIPAKGEICLVDTAADGLRVICGDGVSTFGQLKFIGDLLERAYLKDGIFYEDDQFEVELLGSKTKIYLDLFSYNLYVYDGLKYRKISEQIPTATAKVSGTVKLYNEMGQNTDGTMTQKAITDELNEKVEMLVHPKEEMLVLSTDLI